MGQRADREVVHAGRATSRALASVRPPLASSRARPAPALTAAPVPATVEVVEQDQVGARRDRLGDLRERVALDLDRQPGAAARTAANAAPTDPAAAT